MRLSLKTYFNCHQTPESDFVTEFLQLFSGMPGNLNHIRIPAAFHTTCGVDCVTKQAVARNFKADNTGDKGTRVESYLNKFVEVLKPIKYGNEFLTNLHCDTLDVKLLYSFKHLK